MRWHILKTLLHKEALRHATNRGGLALAGLLVTASLLLAALNPAAEKDKPATLVGGIHHCLIWYDEDDGWARTNTGSTKPGPGGSSCGQWQTAMANLATVSTSVTPRATGPEWPCTRT